ncbi:unnamed protein product [Cylindrotheca closterium]|uniref:Uncharacterized protein n=1 Tax=Cylindrotheca closterium TaxID=2856 RepID=A0AAD2CJP3_9STRA|nr:unnamed protein product [Cylindrotheca closterium]
MKYLSILCILAILVWINSRISCEVSRYWLQGRRTTKSRDDDALQFSSGSTGSRFTGEKVRRCDDCGLHGAWSNDSAELFPDQNSSRCLQWAVVTTIFEPNESIFRVSRLKNWCLVIVGDTKTSDSAYYELATKKNIFYLSAAYQKDLMLNRHSFMSMMPFNSFARKNIGYLFAVTQGARVIFDFDDDNVLEPLEDIEVDRPPFLLEYDNGDFEGSKKSVLLRFVPQESKPDMLPFNPYSLMNASHAYSWPRGFPIDEVQASWKGWGEIPTKFGSIKYSSIGVIQSLCNGDPDNDAVFRMTRLDSTKFTFDHSVDSFPLLVPSSAYSPYNAQATTHLYKAFWGLYLPVTVPGRVTDIWRGYITQRIMKEIGLHLIFTPPIVVHKRSPHDYLSDFEAEKDLYTKSSRLLEFLNGWSSETQSLKEMILELWIELFERDYIQLHDVKALTAWLSVLDHANYQFPDRIDSILKVIMMTRNEWPLITNWVAYHGLLLGFENVYIIDGSTNPKCISYLHYARDILGANVIFTDANLNKLSILLTALGKQIAGSSDYVMKMDTDEFLAVYDDGSNSLKTSVSDYLFNFTVHGNDMAGQARVGYLQASLPSKEICQEDINSSPESFPLGPIRFAGDGIYKAVYKSGYLENGTLSINLGGHVSTSNLIGYTKLAIFHFHLRYYETEIMNSMQAVEQHGYIDRNQSEEKQFQQLARLLNCAVENFCDLCGLRTCVPSCHKVLAVARFYACPDDAKTYYNLDKSNLPYVPLHNATTYYLPTLGGVTNLDFLVTLQESIDRYGLVL